MKKTWIKTCSAWALLGLAACANPAAPNSVTIPAPVNAVPAWRKNGSGAFETDGKRVFYGVATVSGIRNSRLRASTANNKAKTEVINLFALFTESIMNSYATSRTTASPAAHDEFDEPMVEARAFVKEVLGEVQIIDHYEDAGSDTTSALAILRLDTFVAHLDNAQGFDAQTKQFLQANAGRIHADMEARQIQLEANPGVGK